MRILYLPVKVKSMTAILMGGTGTDYHKRQISEHWYRRLEDKQFDAIEFHNGYQHDSPRIQYEYKGTFAHQNGHYYIRLGKLLSKNEAADKLASAILTTMLERSLKSQ